MSQDREKSRIVVNAASNMVWFVAQAAVVFVMSPMLVHGLGNDRYGVWLVVDSVLAYLALADLGIGAAVLRYVAKFEGLEDNENMNRVFSTSFALFACAGAMVGLATFGIAFSSENPLGVSEKLIGPTRWLLVILGTQLALSLPLGIYKTVLAGLRCYPTVSLIRIAMLLLRNGLFMVALASHWGLVGIGLAVIVSNATDWLCSAIAAHRKLPELRFSFRFVDRATFRSIRGYSAYIFISLIAGKFCYQLSPIVIGAFITPAAVTYFGIAASLSTQAADAIRQLIAVLTPTVSKWEAVGEHSSIRALLIVGTRCVLFLVIPVQLGLIFFGYPFLSLWMGREYADASFVTLVILCAPLPFVLVQSMAVRVLQGVGRVAAFSLVTVLQAALTMLLSIALVKPLGIEGVAIATSAPLMLHCLVVTVLVCRTVGVPIMTLVQKAFVLPVASSSILVVVWLLVANWLPPTNWATFGITLVAGLVPYTIVMLRVERTLTGFAVRTLTGFVYRSGCDALSGGIVSEETKA
jgi:O-antigen/teichoic acid export membrane protein